MTDDMEDKLRRALRADSDLITRESLHFTGLRTAQPTHRVRVLATASVAAAAIIAGAVIAAQSVSAPSVHRLPVGAAGDTAPTAATTSPASADPFARSKWKLTAINHDGHDTQVAANFDATIAFADGRVVMDDTVNALSGTYTRTSTGFTLSQLATTLVGMTGATSDRVLVIQAIHAITGAVPATVDGDTMVLTATKFTLTFSRDGNAPTYASPAHTSSTIVDVTCTPQGVSISQDSVAATAAGVQFRVTNKTDPGAYLNFASARGGGGDPLPASPASWTRLLPPGPARLSCSRPDWKSPDVVLQVTDPNNFWRPRTLAEEGCPQGAIPSWVISAGRGTTADAAAGALLDLFAQTKGGMFSAPGRTAKRAAVGYPDAAQQTWLLIDGTGKPRVTVMITNDGKEYVAEPDELCG